MSDYKLLSYSIFFSIAFHIFIFRSLINLRVASPSFSALNQVEIIFTQDVLPDFSVSGLTDFTPLDANLVNPLPQQLEGGKRSEATDLPKFNKINYLRGGEASNFESMLPLQSLPEKTNLGVNFSDRQYSKVVPDFRSDGLDLLSGEVLAQETGVLAARPSTAAIANKQEQLPTINKGDFVKKYQKELLERIRSVINYPGWARRAEIRGQVTLELLIKHDGVVANIGVYKTSGNSRLDEEAIKSVASISSFPELPKELAANQAKVLIPVTYNLN